MRSSLKWKLFTVVAPVCFLVMGCPPIIPPMGDRVPSAKSSDLHGVWLGQDDHHWGSIYRLELVPSGDGLLGISSNDVQPSTQIYQVDHWTVDDRGRFSCTLRQISTDCVAPFRIRGWAHPRYVSLEVGEQSDPTKWDKGPRMVRERDFLKDLEQKRKWALDLDEQMRRYRSNKR